MGFFEDIRKLQGQVSKALNLRGGNTVSATPGPDGMMIQVPQEVAFLVRITANYGDGSYGWTSVYQVDYTDYNADLDPLVNVHGSSELIGHQDDTPAGDAGTGIVSGDQDTWLAYERQKRTGVPIGAFVWVKYHFATGDQNAGSPDQQWVFDFKPENVQSDVPWTISTTLDGSINATQSTMVPTDDGKFPSLNKFLIQIGSEQMLVGSPNTGTGTWSSVIRGWNSTTPATHSNGATITLLNALLGDVDRLISSLVFEAYPGFQGTKSGAITACTGNGTSPIVITSNAHGLAAGDIVLIQQVGGNDAANGVHEVTATTTNTFTILGTGTGAYTSGGTWQEYNNDTSAAMILNQVQPIDVVSGPDEDGFFSGNRLYYDPNSETIKTLETIKAIDLNAF